MEQLLALLVEYALKHQASDIHLILENRKLKLSLRTSDGFLPVIQDVFDERFLEYLKFCSGMNLTARFEPQSGSFQTLTRFGKISCRFSVLTNRDLVSGVIRILHSGKKLTIQELSSDRKSRDSLKRMIRAEHGLIIFAGPTGSGKTTTVHAILHEMAQDSTRKIVSLEDPIEIEDRSYLQLEINENQNFTYEKGIEELMRHDPDVIFIGECRTSYTAKMACRAALTGHLVFTTLHSGTVRETIRRMIEFGVSESDLGAVLQGVFAQRLFPSVKRQTENTVQIRKECVYEHWKRSDIEEFFESGSLAAKPASLLQQIRKAEEAGFIPAGSWKNSGL